MMPPVLNSRENERRLSQYLDRIGFDGTVAPDLDTLRKIHRCHVEAISWENLDMHLGRSLSLDPELAFDKIVRKRRGGWCYEMNGLLSWMLELVGFRITRMAAGVARDRIGDLAVGNHLALIVHLDEHYLADAGLGSGLVEPVPLKAGVIEQFGRRFSLEPIENGWWRFHNHPDSAPPTFDFHLDVVDEALLQDRCKWLQSDPASPFWRMPIIQRYRSGILHSLIGPSASRHLQTGIETIKFAQLDQYADYLTRFFEIEFPDIERIWQLIDTAPSIEGAEGESRSIAEPHLAQTSDGI